MNNSGRMQTLGEIIERNACYYPAKQALVALQGERPVHLTFAQVAERAPMPPPPPQTELVPPPPSSSVSEVWQPGHWNYTGVASNPWTWENGRYVGVPRGANTWVPGQWTRSSTNGWVWVDGHWA